VATGKTKISDCFITKFVLQLLPRKHEEIISRLHGNRYK